MRIVFFGNPAYVIPVIESLKNAFILVAVVTSPDAKSGRNRLLTPTPVKDYAQNHALPLIAPHSWDKQAQEEIKKLRADLFVVAAYGHLLPKEVLDIPKYGALVIHPSLLPLYRGACPIQAAILHGDKETGVSIITMDEKMDHGSLLAQEKIIIEPGDTSEKLYKTLFKKGADLLVKRIPDFVLGTVTPIPQDDSKATFTWKTSETKNKAYFDSNNPPSKEVIDRMIRAFYPWPLAWSRIRIKNQDLRIKFLPKNIVQLEGKKPVDIETFLRGYPETKDFFEKIF